MRLPLTESTKLDLSNLHHGCKEKYLADKIKSIQLLSKGYKQKEIGGILSVSGKTLYNWKQEFLNSSSVYDFASKRTNSFEGKLNSEKKTSL